MSSGSAQRIERRAGQRDRRQRALPDDHRVDELDRDVPGIRPPARERATDSNRPPRRKRSAIASQSLAMRATPRRRSARRARSAPRASRLRRRGARSATFEPLPPLAHSLAGARAQPHHRDARMHRLHVASRRSTSKSRCGSRSILLITTSSQVRNISGYLSGLSSPSVTGDHHPRVLANSEFSRADQIADVLDHQQVDLLKRGPAGPSAPCSRRDGIRRRSRAPCAAA